MILTMSIGILGKKVGMTRVYDATGAITPVTVILAEPNSVLQVKTKEKDGYDAAQMGVDEVKESRVSKPNIGHFKKSGATPKRFVREFRIDGKDLEETKAGAAMNVTRFQVGQLVDVIGL